MSDEGDKKEFVTPQQHKPKSHTKSLSKDLMKRFVSQEDLTGDPRGGGRSGESALWGRTHRKEERKAKAE